jgi:hypothetical protein
MAYQNPLFGFLHAGADAGAASFTHSTDGDSDFPKDNLIDFRTSSLFKWETNKANHFIKLDRGAGTLEEIDRLVIPAGSNTTGATWTVYAHTADAGATVAAWIAAGATYHGAFGGSADLIDHGFSDAGGAGETSKRWLFISTTSGGAWEIPELWLTHQRQTTTRGPRPTWTDQPIAQLITRSFATREAVTVLAPNRRSMALEYLFLNSTDVDIFDDLFSELNVGGKPFWFWPPDDSLDPYLMSITNRQVTRRQDHPAPAAGDFRYRVRFEMLEQTS